MAEPVAQAHPLEHRPRLNLGVALLGKLERQHDVLEGGQRREQLERLEDETDQTLAQRGAPVLIQRKELDAIQAHAAPRCRIQSRE